MTKVQLGGNAWPISCVILLACAWFGGLVPSLVASLIFIFSLKAIHEYRGLFEFTRKELIDSALLLLLTSAVGWSREVWRRQAAQLREEARRKDQFLATHAHELRNPLAPLRNGLEILGMGTIDAAAAATNTPLPLLPVRANDFDGSFADLPAFGIQIQRLCYSAG